MTEILKWALLATILLTLSHVQTSGLGEKSYEELLLQIKSGTFTLDGKSKDDSKAVLQQILDESKY